MEKVNRLLKDPGFKEYMHKNQLAETSRIYCRHDLNHAFNVARIAYILNLEENCGLDKEAVYAAGLLHDIGRWAEYSYGLSHDLQSARLAKPILYRCGFSEWEAREVADAINSHRIVGSGKLLSDVLYRADKLSRNCLNCNAIKTCKRFSKGEKPLLEY